MLHRTECVFPSACPPQAPKFFGSGLVCRIRKLREMTEACRGYRRSRGFAIFRPEVSNRLALRARCQIPNEEDARLYCVREPAAGAENF